MSRVLIAGRGVHVELHVHAGVATVLNDPVEVLEAFVGQ
jgi:hypothetical protein